MPALQAALDYGLVDQVLDKRTRKPPRLEVQNAKGEIVTANDLELVTVKN